MNSNEELRLSLFEKMIEFIREIKDDIYVWEEHI
jgi:hypothetical protein